MCVCACAYDCNVGDSDSSGGDNVYALRIVMYYVAAAVAMEIVAVEIYKSI